MESTEPWIAPGGFVTIMALLWTLRCDMARLDGSFDVLTKLLIDRERERT